MTKSVILLVGAPGIGKTTIVRDVISSAVGYFGGFYTVAMLEGTGRTGFEIVTLDGKRVPLAAKDGNPHGPRVGAYRVNIESIDNYAVPAIVKAAKNGKIVVIDEIGPMEVLSNAFRSSVRDMVQNPDVVVFGTIVQRHCEFADEIKAHPRVHLIGLTRANRNHWLAPLRASLGL